jgi:hypothetical protein
MAALSYPRKTLLCRLYEKTSSRGTQYFQRRLDAAKLVLLQTQEISESGEPGTVNLAALQGLRGQIGVSSRVG